MKAFKYLLFLLLIIIIGASIYIEVQPNTYTFSRSRIIAAPTPVIFNEVNDYKNWPHFSPWLEQEPEVQLTYLEKTSDIGAGYAWKGTILGEGKMTTLAVSENKSIAQKINFIKPFESESDIHWTFEPQNDSTKVTWTMSGKLDFMSKMYTTFSAPFEKTVGPDFERGLFKLDSVSMASMKAYSIKVMGITQHGGGYYLYKTTSCKISELPNKTQTMLPTIAAYVYKNNISTNGIPFVNYHKWDEENNAVMFSCCIPTTEKMISTESDILTGQLPPFSAVKTILKGNYSYLNEAWAKGASYIQENGLETLEQGPTIEVYSNLERNLPNPADWITEIYIAIQPLEDSFKMK
ncbi:SRPBCC family protein [Algibacter pacificus]|uniref:SRPBCC family protein n=1 Tax=Algibacter pacificus TaxID=2599389 RepID=UPI0011CCAFAE|nr:SRPBCC family protein [Algibacter pacificus]